MCLNVASAMQRQNSCHTRDSRETIPLTSHLYKVLPLSLSIAFFSMLLNTRWHECHKTKHLWELWRKISPNVDVSALHLEQSINKIAERKKVLDCNHLQPDTAVFFFPSITFVPECGHYNTSPVSKCDLCSHHHIYITEYIVGISIENGLFPSCVAWAQRLPKGRDISGFSRVG